jgi:RNA polymerase sigma-70 factor (ECF subfamily)
MGDYQKDQELLNRVRAGDENAIFEVYQTNYPKIIRFLKKDHAQPEEVEDIAQSTFLAFLKIIREGKLEVLTSSLSTYLIGVARKISWGRWRKEQRQKQDFELPHWAVHQKPGDSPDQEALMAVVEFVLPQLKEECYKMIYGTYYHKMSNEELARQLNYRNARVVANLKNRCMEKLRELVAEECKRRGL